MGMQYFGFLAFYLQDSYLKNGKYEKTDFNGGGGADGASRGGTDAGGFPQLYSGERTRREGDHARRVLPLDRHQRARFEGQDFGRESAARHDRGSQAAGRERREAAEGGQPFERVLQEEHFGGDGQVPASAGIVGRGGQGVAGARRTRHLERFDPEGVALEDRRV